MKFYRGLHYIVISAKFERKENSSTRTVESITLGVVYGHESYTARLAKAEMREKNIADECIIVKWSIK